MQALDFSEAEARALAKAASEQGLEQLAKDCEEALAGRLSLARCFPLQAAVEAWRKLNCNRTA